MMNAKTFRLFIVLLISIVFPTPSQGGEPSSALSSLSGKSKTELPTIQGLYFSADVFGYIYPIFMKDKYYSTEISATMNINNRFLPTIEVGLGHTNMVSQLYDIGYRTRAPYYRIGMDYNMQYKKGKPNYIYLGGRVGYTSFSYSVDAPPLIDPIWGNSVSMQLTDLPCHAIWAEAVGGVRAEISKNLYLGWSLRYKLPLHRGPISNGGPWYIPGFGTGKENAFGATYTISYYFNLTRKRL